MATVKTKEDLIVYLPEGRQVPLPQVPDKDLLFVLGKISDDAWQRPFMEEEAKERGLDYKPKLESLDPIFDAVDRDKKVDAYLIKLDRQIVNGDFDRVRNKVLGIRSRQVTALLALLVEKGIL